MVTKRERQGIVRPMKSEQIERIRFAGNGVTIVADAMGPADGVPVLFLHGGGQTRQSWRRAVRETARRGYRALTLDLRGHGDSDWAPDGIYSMDHFAEDIRAVIATIGRSPVIVGASMGGLVGLTIAGSGTDEVAGLVLVDVAARIEPDGAQEIGAFMNSAPDGFANLEEAADAVAAYLPHRPRPKDTSGLMRNLRQREDGRLRWHWDPAFIRPRTRRDRNEGEFEEAARRLTVPTLLIRGGRSRVVSVEGVQSFLELAPHAEYVDVAGADHMVAGDANDAFNTAVFDFLDRHFPATPQP